MKEYKRLTQKSDNGYGIDGNLINQKQRAFDVCIDSFEIVLNRLAELEDKIENGTLIELPCKVGDKAYLVHNETQRYPFEFVVEDVRYMKGSWYVDSSTYGGKVGKYVFFTKTEAEKKLKEFIL